MRRDRARKGGRIANADITLICEAPRIGPHREAMTEAIADDARHCDRSRVSVKATTNEKLGFIGREEGIAAIATASVVYPGEVAGMSDMGRPRRPFSQGLRPPQDPASPPPNPAPAA